jgi:hypothetical protein
VKTLAVLEPELVLTFHGRPVQGPKMRDSLKRLAREFRAIAVPKHGKYLAEPRRAADGSAYERL